MRQFKRASPIEWQMHSYLGDANSPIGGETSPVQAQVARAH